MNKYIVIMAGGSGKRFWPHSTKEKPKQFLKIVGKKTMLQQTISRILKIVPRKNIIIVTNKFQAPLVKEQLPWLSPGNIIAEPKSRNTAPCIGVAAKKIYQADPKGVMIVLPADHVIQDNKKFCDVMIASAVHAAKNKVLVTIGIKPDKPHTGYGYIKLGSKLKQKFYEVDKFAEKPKLPQAKKYYASGKYLWNSGMFVWRADTILNEIKSHMPQLSELLKKRGLNEIYRKAKNISIDYGIMEKTDKAVVREADFNWDDVGNWNAVCAYYPKDSSGNVLRGNCISIDTKESLVVSDKKITAVLGLNNVVVVTTKDAVLVCSKDKVQKVKEIVELLNKKK